MGRIILCKTENYRETCDNTQKWILDSKVGKDLLNVINLCVNMESVFG